jgi:RNA polymerase sigma-70 factor, ECF subfamily
VRDGEARLIGRARVGALDAWEELLRRHERAVWRTAYLIVGRRALADEVTQDVFLRAFEAFDRFDDTRPLRPWLVRMAANRALNVGRGERRVEPVADVPDRGAVDWLADPDERGVRRSLATLDPEVRAAVVLRYWFDLPAADIAVALDMPIGTVHSRLSRALATLRAQIEETRHD